MQDKYQSKIDEVLKEFQERAMEAVHKVCELIHSEDERIALDASKYTIKITGAEIDRLQHSGSVTFEPLKLSRGDDE